jgi:hypothetical protein
MRPIPFEFYYKLVALNIFLSYLFFFIANIYVTFFADSKIIIKADTPKLVLNILFKKNNELKNKYSKKNQK